jgi:hypothetical protein
LLSKEKRSLGILDRTKENSLEYLSLPIEACLFTVKHQQQEQIRPVLEISGALAIKNYNYNYQVKTRQVERQS